MARSVLLVDDELPVHEALNLMVDWKGLGFLQPDSAMNGASALEMLKKKDYDLVITDICMPTMDGLAFMRTLKQMNSDVQIIVITAYERFSYAQQALRCGARDLFLKPLDRQELTESLRKVAQELQASKPEKANSTYSRDELYQKTLEILNENFRQDISVQKLAEMLYVNPSYLGQYFIRMNGSSILEYVNRKRIDWVKAHIDGKNVYIQKIITDAGYKNCGYFYRLFQKMEGISFTEYREAEEKRIRKKTEGGL